MPWLQVKIHPSYTHYGNAEAAALRRTEERHMREDFNAEYGAHIPTDICLCIENPPTRWEVVPWAGDVREVLPEIDADLLPQMKVSWVLMRGLRSLVRWGSLDWSWLTAFSFPLGKGEDVWRGGYTR